MVEERTCQMSLTRSGVAGVVAAAAVRALSARALYSTTWWVAERRTASVLGRKRLCHRLCPTAVSNGCVKRLAVLAEVGSMGGPRHHPHHHHRPHHRPRPHPHPHRRILILIIRITIFVLVLVAPSNRMHHQAGVGDAPSFRFGSTCMGPGL